MQQLRQNSIRIEHQDYALTSQLYNNKLRISLQFFSLHDYKVFTSIYTYQQLPQIFQFFYESIQEVFVHFKNKSCVTVNAQKGVISLKIQVIKNQNKSIKNLQLSLSQQTVQENVRNAVIIGKLTNALNQTKQQVIKKDKQNRQLKQKFVQILCKMKIQINSLKQKDIQLKHQINQIFKNLSTFKDNFSQKCKQIHQQISQQQSNYYFQQRQYTLSVCDQYQIRANSNNVIITTSQQVLALIQSCYTYEDDEIYSIQFIMLTKTGPIGIGVCNKTVVQQNQYCLDIQQNNATYMLIDNYTISTFPNDKLKDHSQQFNTIQQGDIIRVTLQPKNQKIIIKNVKNQQFVQLKYRRMKRKNLYFCIYIQQQGDMVRIRQVWQ